MEKRIVITASFLGFMAVLLGAFAAHGLKNILNEQQIISFQTGVRYQFYHTFLLLFIAHTTYVDVKSKKYIYRLILFGILLFSGSIYVLCLDEYLLGQNIKGIGLVTPLGGLLLLAAWGLLFIKAVKYKSS